MTLAELRQYVEDFETGVTMWRHDLDARLASLEIDLAIVKEHLVTRMRADKRGANPDAPFQPRINPQFVAERLHLTPNESRVAALLAEGRSVQETASVIGRKESTVRWFLRQINRKLKISRQHQLVRLVLLLPHDSGDETDRPHKRPDRKVEAQAFR